MLKSHRVQENVQIGVFLGVHLVFLQLKPHTRLLAGGKLEDLELKSERLLSDQNTLIL